MTRKITQWPKVKPGDYARWLEDFEVVFVRKLLKNFTPTERDQICTMLFAARIGPQQLTREEVRRIWPKLDEQKLIKLTRINLADYVIASLAALLKVKTRSVNKDIAALLTAAGVPGGNRDTSGWSAETIKKRRKRCRPRKRARFLWVANWGPRFLLRELTKLLLTARQRG